MGKVVYTKVPLGEHRDKEFPGQRKAHFVSNLQSQIGKPASRGWLEIRAREMLYFKGSRVAQWRWGRRSASEWVRQRLCKGQFSGLKEAQEASTCGSQGLFPGPLVSSHHASHHRELWSLFRFLKTQCQHEDPTLLISRKSQHEPSLLTPLDLRVSAFRTEINFH